MLGSARWRSARRIGAVSPRATRGVRQDGLIMVHTWPKHAVGRDARGAMLIALETASIQPAAYSHRRRQQAGSCNAKYTGNALGCVVCVAVLHAAKLRALPDGLKVGRFLGGPSDIGHKAHCSLPPPVHPLARQRRRLGQLERVERATHILHKLRHGLVGDARA